MDFANWRQAVANLHCLDYIEVVNTITLNFWRISGDPSQKLFITSTTDIGNG